MTTPTRTVRRRELGALLAALAVGAFATPSAQAKTVKPTVVLVHGACADSSSWDGVIARLQASGYTSVASANPLRGVAFDAEQLAALLRSVKGPIVLVGHSYGGMLISVAAAGNAKVKSLVFVDAQIPEIGENAAELTNKFPGSEFGSALVSVPFTLSGGATGTDLHVDPGKYRRLFTGPRVSAA